MGTGDSGTAHRNVKQYAKDMTTFELHEDYRTAAHEALQLLGLDRNDIDTATHYHELFAHLGSAEKRLALAAVEVYKMYCFRERKEHLLSSKDIFEEMKLCLTDVEVEECWVILLNQANRIIRKVRVSVGGISAVTVDVRVIFKEAIKVSATAIVLVHNHPGGTPRPSPEDDRLTQQVSQAARIMNIRLMDHLIFADGGFYSYHDEGRL